MGEEVIDLKKLVSFSKGNMNFSLHSIPEELDEIFSTNGRKYYVDVNDDLVKYFDSEQDAALWIQKVLSLETHELAHNFLPSENMETIDTSQDIEKQHPSVVMWRINQIIHHLKVFKNIEKEKIISIVFKIMERNES